jgi:putative acetyltransferase
VVIGHSAFYPRFGFVPAARYGLTCDWNVPAEAFMVNILSSEIEGRLCGRVRYGPEFATA